MATRPSRARESWPRPSTSSSLDGYSTGGTLHLIANNQVGFTTDPAEGRSTRYSSDLAKGFDVPIVHVNADDPEAALAAIRLALAYRDEFGHDVVVDLVGYRRFGHNEQDEAAYTQPLQSERIEQQVPVRESYAARLVADGVVGPDDSARMFEETLAELRAAHDELRTSFAAPIPPSELPTKTDTGAAVVTAVTADRLVHLGEQLLEVPDGFDVNPKLARQLERRRESLQAGGIDWGHAEALAFATLLEDGIPIRLSGQDTERGTFSHRQAVLHDPRHGGDATRRCRRFRQRRRRSRSTTRRSRSTRRSHSSTATRSRLPTRSCCGRRSSETS